MAKDNKVITQTKAWVSDVIVGDNFCPFARREVVNNRVRYVIAELPLESLIEQVTIESEQLDNNGDIETTLIVVPQGLENFQDYLAVLEVVEANLIQSGYEGVYQLASFHPDYCFAGADEDDAANYTNRSPYPTFHLIREASISRVLENIDDPASIPDRNIRFAREQGLEAMQSRLKQILGES